MNEKKLSDRLAKVCEFVPSGAIVADIGSDHAYLPAWLILNNKITTAVAGEVVKGPYESACHLVKSLGLEDQITVRLANGLEAVKPEDNVTAVTIAGMGGSLISEILDRGYEKEILSGKERLILQPNIGERTLRLWLQDHSYKIIAEDILEEDGKFYEVIVAEKASEAPTYTEKELQFGPFLLSNQTSVFKAKWADELEQKEYVLKQLKAAKGDQSAKIEKMTQLKTWIEELI
ncbi:tRNA (adenine(22)-N(1))-methyltransferase [Vagococcus fessus]|uniref:SAM-dependent methyltransferase n=1 Tax=Vagococcus fessus TaxID=120370 RepID=A0A430A7P7_9ENTE|nr:tRNA (adenine(22)-N(1))-methyltransferase TrmK [Vagococcus fessus]RSU03097.1 SAM-dependent methyltransferase [Vagococcus fessus]